ncbi:hypothetical protein RFM41_33920 [Mesorhizobium sp. VK25A]|uniref:Integrase n=1 Tax=Mesorhizobium vachelliae TaxID=3072309 RepID=A0ABU5AFC7_9HYPH|nr:MULTISPECIES: hypothetical protein [unclassified Mesorhizobium]MDX8450907.1 hypothetical protein [Mesorhizobium sp. VK3C]MDX8510206.1 hypothetical protein [Mesorhizobium sp. VK22E]MDX8535970.1 hypothetical protein [Mesorhizobium sp. VK25D]MDX8548719.1 hypothetical protein [Mesorhizobium sp. VK25A]
MATSYRAYLRGRCGPNAICDEYEIRLREERGLACSSVATLMWEARNFLAWQTGGGIDGWTGLSSSDVDRYMDLRAPKLTRCSLKDTAERLRLLLRYLHITSQVASRWTCQGT